MFYLEARNSSTGNSGWQGGWIGDGTLSRDFWVHTRVLRNVSGMHLRNITLSIYSHALPVDNEAAAKLWNDAMGDVIAENRKRAAKSGGLSQVITDDRKKRVIPIKSAS